MQIEILRTFVWRTFTINNTGHWCKSFPLFAGTFSLGLWKSPLRVDRNTLVKLFSFRKKSTFCQCGHWWTFFRLLTEVLRRGCKNCIRRFQTLKILLKKSVFLSFLDNEPKHFSRSIIFRYFDKRTLTRLSKWTSTLAETHLEWKDVFF